MTKIGRTYADLLAENRKAVISFAIILLIIVIGLIVSKTYFKIGNIEVGSKQKETKDSIREKISIELRGKQNINGSGNIVIDNSTIIQKDDKQNEFSIKGTSNQNLIKQISDRSRIKFVTNSNNIIEITFTGSLELVEKNSKAYYYSGGHIKIMINQNRCYEFEQFKIDEMRPNSKDLILNEIQNTIDKYIYSNVSLFTQKILECLKI